MLVPSFPLASHGYAYQQSLPRLFGIARRRSDGHLQLNSAVKRRQTADSKPMWCGLIDADSMKRINPQSFAQLTDDAATNLGSDWDTILTNPPEYPELGADGCVVAPVQFSFSGFPDCISTPVQSTRVLATEDGDVILSYDSGTSSLAQMKVAQMAAFPNATTTFTGDVNFPSLHAALATLSSSASFNNTEDATSSVRKQNSATTHVKVLATRGQTCFLALQNVSCTATGEGALQLAYSGHLWFNYHTAKVLNGTSHYRWASDVSLLLSLEQRSTYMTINAAVSSYALVRDETSPQCRDLAASVPLPPPSAKSNPTYKYAAPIAVVAVVSICALLVFWTRRRRRRRARGGNNSSTTPFTAGTASQTSSDRALIQQDPPMTAREKYARWRAATSGDAAGASELPTYSEIAFRLQ